MRKLTTNEFIERAKEIHGNKYNYSNVEYKNAVTKIRILCNQHGSFQQLPYNHLAGRGCRQCNPGPNLSNTETFILHSQKIHGNKYDYKKVRYVNNHTKVNIRCSIHGDFFQRPNDHLSGHACHLCANQKNSTDKFKSKQEFIQNAVRIHKNRYDYTGSNYVGCMFKLEIKCRKCKSSFWQTPNDHLDGHGCPKCVNRISKPETLFLDYIGIKNRQKYINGRHVDGMKDNVIYEFLGDYWHGNPNKFNREDFNPKCKKTFGELYDLTLERFDFLKNLGYKVKYIWESEWSLWLKEPNIILPLREY